MEQSELLRYVVDVVERLNRAYISVWASKMGLDSIWAAILDRINE